MVGYVVNSAGVKFGLVDVVPDIEKVSGSGLLLVLVDLSSGVIFAGVPALYQMCEDPEFIDQEKNNEKLKEKTAALIAAESARGG